MVYKWWIPCFSQECGGKYFFTNRKQRFVDTYNFLKLLKISNLLKNKKSYIFIWNLEFIVKRLLNYICSNICSSERTILWLSVENLNSTQKLLTVYLQYIESLYDRVTSFVCPIFQVRSLALWYLGFCLVECVLKLQGCLLQELLQGFTFQMERFF